MSCMPDMTPTLLAAAEALVQEKVIKNVFERGKNLLQNGKLHFFVFKLSQSSEIVLQS